LPPQRRSHAAERPDAGSLRLPTAVLLADEYVDPAILLAVRHDHCTGSTGILAIAQVPVGILHANVFHDI
jgi:hypothetical protein